MSRNLVKITYFDYINLNYSFYLLTASRNKAFKEMFLI